MTLTLRVLEATDVVYIGGLGSLVGDTSGLVTRVLGHTIVPDLDTDRSGSCRMFVETANLSTKPSSRDDSLVDRLDVSTHFG